MASKRTAVPEFRIGERVEMTHPESGQQMVGRVSERDGEVFITADGARWTPERWRTYGFEIASTAAQADEITDELRAIVEQRASLRARERELVERGRELRVPWPTLAEALGIKHSSLVRRYTSTPATGPEPTD